MATALGSIISDIMYWLIYCLVSVDILWWCWDLSTLCMLVDRFWKLPPPRVSML